MTESSGKGSLPHGWVVKISKNRPDRVYYFNLNTGVSTWECPELDPPKLANVKEDSEGEHISVLNKPSESSNTETAEKFVGCDISSTEESLQGKKPISIPFVKKCVIKKRSLESDTPSCSTDDTFKSLNPPTAIVGPVFAEKKRLLTSPQKLNAQAVNSPTVFKRIKTSPKIEKKHKPSTSSASPKELNESDSTDSDMALEFGASGLYPLVTPASTCSRNVQDSPQDEFSDDIEMLDVSANLTNIDEIAASARESDEPISYYIVVDTNVFIHELKYIDEIKDTPLEGCGPPHIFIPWVVVNELDNLKNSTTKPFETIYAAKKAVRYLNTILKSKHPRFHGQSAKEVEDWAKAYSESNDDKILECCISLAEKMPREKIILLTNDKNLANKAMISDITVHDQESMIKELKPDVTLKGTSSLKRKKKKKSTKPHPISQTISCQKNLERKLVKERNVHETEIDDLMCKARKLLKDVLDPLLVEKMNEAYGDAWYNFEIDRRLLRGVLGAYLRHWSTVFSFHFSKKDKHTFELLQQKVIRPKGFYGNLEESLVILHAIEDIFCSILKHGTHYAVPLTEIQTLIETCSSIFSKCDDIDSSISVVESAMQSNEEKSVLETFDHNWNIINEMCGMIMDFCGLPHNFVYEKPSTIPPESEYRRVLTTLYPSLLQLKQFMKKILDILKASTPNHHFIFKKLFTALNNLIPSLNVKYTIPNLPHFTPKALERFCRNPENREKVECGYQQLVTFCDKLNEAIKEMVSLKKKTHDRNSQLWGVSET